MKFVAVIQAAAPFAFAALYRLRTIFSETRFTLFGIVRQVIA
jgi:hypothetical protein